MRNMLYSRIIVVLLLGVPALLMGLRQASNQSRAEARLTEELARLGTLREAIAASELAVRETRAEARSQSSARDRALASLRTLEQAASSANSESRWVEPPSQLPDWNAESPYVWLEKESLPWLPIRPFVEDGILDSSVAELLKVEPDQRSAISAKIRALSGEFRKLETAHTRVTTNHPPGLNGPGKKITIEVEPLPHEGAQIREEMAAFLRDTVGHQRAELLLGMGRLWLDKHFNDFGAASKTIGVIQHPNGTQNISIRSGMMWMSTAGPRVIEDHVPSHLRHFFDPMGPTNAEER